jgi:hypothetical protein
MHRLWVALIAAGSTLGAAGLGARLGARFSTRAALDECESRRRRDLEAALASHYSATVKAVAAVSRLPNVDPKHWFHQFSE